MKKTLHIFLFFFIITLLGCIDTMDLPTAVTDTPKGISSDKDAYIELTPRWSFEELGVSDIRDMVVAKDGRLYLADPKSNKISVIRTSGSIEEGVYDTLRSLIVHNHQISPFSVTVDSRFIVYFTDKSDTVYAWFQYMNMVEIEGIVTSFNYLVNNEMVTANPLVGEFNEAYRRIPGSEILDTNPSRLDSLLKPLPIYISRAKENSVATIDPVTGEALGNNPVYAKLAKSFNAIAPEGSDMRTIAVMDSLNNRLIKFRLLPTVLVKLKNGRFIWHYKGVYENFIAEQGTGAGTVSKPVSLYSDPSGNLLYTQLGDYFGIHKLQYRNGNYSSAFSLGLNDIMDLDRFEAAMDVVVGDDASIFVLDSALHAVLKFSANGDFQKFVAVREEWIQISDTTWIDEQATVKDTLIQTAFHDLLDSPQCLAFYNDVLYVADRGHKKVLRFTRTKAAIEDPNPYD
ncbi:MAG: hypothetical protein PHE86_05445 [Candidatus Marinimicrobia bacterium]|nr:hypothetical protein [Candidatus Neomarinimicrobiota bacterium]